MNILRRSPGATYRGKIMALDPILYYPFNELNGVVANNLGNLGADANGTYSGASLANAAGPKGDVCPYFDGINDNVNFFTDALVNNVNKNEGTMAIWLKAQAASFWTDTKSSTLFRMIFVNSEHFISMYKSASFMARTAYKNVASGPTYNFNPNTAEWLHLAITYSISAAQFITYLNGVAAHAPYEITVAPYGVPTSALICGVMWGWAAHAALFNKALTPTEVARIGT